MQGHALLRLHAWAILGSILLVLPPARSPAFEPCRIHIVEKGTGWPVPLVELKTTHHVRLVSDNAGVIAFDLPEFMNREIWLHVEGHGYTVPADGFGYRGVRVAPQPGGQLTIEVERQVPSRRLGRLTGAGLFAEAQRFGDHLDWQEQGIVGCDSVQCAIHQDQLYWIWGDTTLANYPLGLFHTLSATTPVRPLANFAPPIGLRYRYFCTPQGAPRSVAALPGDGPTWLSGYVSLADERQRRRLVATYSKIRPPLSPYEQGLCIWNDASETFEEFHELWNDSAETPAPIIPQGHATHWTDEAGMTWLLFGDPFPQLKCPATFEGWSQPDRWEILQPQTQVETAAGKDLVTPHRGSIAYHPFCQKWVTVFTQAGGSPSFLGELWYAEADSPMGPWRDAVKVVTHHNYTFYNPRLHPEWIVAGSPVLLFEATYTSEFAHHAPPTPRHNYNQVLYRLDLDELRDSIWAVSSPEN